MTQAHMRWASLQPKASPEKQQKCDLGSSGGQGWRRGRSFNIRAPHLLVQDWTLLTSGKYLTCDHHSLANIWATFLPFQVSLSFQKAGHIERSSQGDEQPNFEIWWQPHRPKGSRGGLHSPTQGLPRHAQQVALTQTDLLLCPQVPQPLKTEEQDQRGEICHQQSPLTIPEIQVEAG